jgi:hypothetical protein
MGRFDDSKDATMYGRAGLPSGITSPEIPTRQWQDADKPMLKGQKLHFDHNDTRTGWDRVQPRPNATSGRRHAKPEQSSSTPNGPIRCTAGRRAFFYWRNPMTRTSGHIHSQHRGLTLNSQR